jgi:hypothetical protein
VNKRVSNAVSRIADVLQTSVCDACNVARTLLPDFVPSEIMSKPLGKPVERFKVFSKGRTKIVINYSDGRDNEVVRCDSAREYERYMDSVRS